MKLTACIRLLIVVSFIFINLQGIADQDYTKETKQEKDQRMQWWREARFGLFIHWGLYAIPAGQWGEHTDFGEQIRDEAQIPLEEYEKLRDQFNPTEFNAREWVQIAKNAGMKYIVITSKHIDGFCLFDSKVTDWDVMSTPFKRDILKELSDACREEGIKICFYYAIMDLHHPDYLPRRNWEKTIRPETGADFNRYVDYMKAQLRELVVNYGPLGVLWFDAEWEDTWTHQLGVEFYNYVRSLQPSIIINNRVDKGRVGMSGFSSKENVGDFATPEQEIPHTGVTEVDWESCITMNRHWGYNARDKDYKSTKELIHILVDTVSKGGNLLLNVGPMANGKFPPEAIERLNQIGEWMKVNGEAIYGTTVCPLPQPTWGRYTQKTINNECKQVYLHIFNYTPGSTISIPINQLPNKKNLLKDRSVPINVTLNDNQLNIQLPEITPDPYATVIALHFS